ncbi:hypothetical protein F952_01125 [Acinetobacter baylyi DSM 14961 = CIP 107474]|nr:hypothetical protein F952_01125 [Acinetobacter baylyi DSM 14961 = CIP 107474]
MSGQRYTPEFKDEAVKLITERGYLSLMLQNVSAYHSTAFING